MPAAAYYNEIDPYAAQWLRNLIDAGHIAPGIVDTRSIEDVRPDDLAGFTQCHFFAGIGGWSLAARLAGWPDERPLWSGSSPCQPFSAAGKGGGFDDERHLWPALHYFIEQRHPEIFVGEQVASKDGLAWLDLVQADMEGTGYAFAAHDLCAAGVGAPHIRQRLWIVAHAAEPGRCEQPVGNDRAHRRTAAESRRLCVPRLVVDSVESGLERFAGHGDDRHEPGRLDAEPDGSVAATSSARGVVDADGRDASAEGLQQGGEYGLGSPNSSIGDSGRPGPVNGFWRDADWLRCRDGKWRPVESGTFPLAHGVSGGVELVRTRKEGTTEVQETHRYSRVGALRAYGNAIVIEAAATHLRAVLDVIDA